MIEAVDHALDGAAQQPQIAVHDEAQLRPLQRQGVLGIRRDKRVGDFVDAARQILGIDVRLEDAQQRGQQAPAQQVARLTSDVAYAQVTQRAAGGEEIRDRLVHKINVDRFIEAAAVEEGPHRLGQFLPTIGGSCFDLDSLARRHLVIPVHAGDLLDQVHLAIDVAAPRRHGTGDELSRRRGSNCRADRIFIALSAGTSMPSNLLSRASLMVTSSGLYLRG